MAKAFTSTMGETVAASDRRHSEEFTMNIRYSEEITENLRPKHGLSQPVYAPGSFSKVEKWKVDRVYIFLCSMTVICMGALIWHPSPDTQAAVASIWVSAAALGQYLLKYAYRGPKDKRKKYLPQ
jgi:hypothetical protein